jgi:hypothetical protein
MIARGPLHLLWVTSDIGFAGVVIASLINWVPPTVALIAGVWYGIQIIESKTLTTILRSYRLRRLVKLRAKAVALELLIRTRNIDVRELARANEVHLAAEGAAQKHVIDALHAEQTATENQRLEQDLLKIKPPV